MAEPGIEPWTSGIDSTVCVQWIHFLSMLMVQIRQMHMHVIIDSECAASGMGPFCLYVRALDKKEYLMIIRGKFSYFSSKPYVVILI